MSVLGCWWVTWPMLWGIDECWWVTWPMLWGVDECWWVTWPILVLCFWSFDEGHDLCWYWFFFLEWDEWPDLCFLGVFFSVDEWPDLCWLCFLLLFLFCLFFEWMNDMIGIILLLLLCWWMTGAVLALCAAYTGKNPKTALCTRPTLPVKDAFDAKRCWKRARSQQ